MRSDSVTLWCASCDVPYTVHWTKETDAQCPHCQVKPERRTNDTQQAQQSLWRVCSFLLTHEKKATRNLFYATATKACWCAQRARGQEETVRVWWP